jgi:hypothetical protein
MQDIVQWDYGSWPDGLPKKGGANALSGAGSLDTATTCLSKTSRTKNFGSLVFPGVQNYGNLNKLCLHVYVSKCWEER